MEVRVFFILNKDIVIAIDSLLKAFRVNSHFLGKFFNCRGGPSFVNRNSAFHCIVNCAVIRVVLVVVYDCISIVQEYRELHLESRHGVRLHRQYDFLACLRRWNRQRWSSK